jgi:CelD/BcsL family acetyltransferase involved in cellulose biosynthesis
LRLILLREIPEDHDLQRQWNALVMRSEGPQVFYTYEWALAVQRAYSSTLHPLLFLGYDDNSSLSALAALAVDASHSLVTFLCATTGDYCDFLSKPEDRDSFVEHVIEELIKLGFKKMAFANLPADSSTNAALRLAARRYATQYFARVSYVCAQIWFDRLEQGKDGKPVAPGLKRLRRFTKAMANEGPIRIDHCRSWDTVEPVLPQFLQAHVGRFLEIGRISNLANARRRMFLAELAKVSSESQWVVLTRLSVAERSLAWHYGFVFHDTWFWYQPTFDSSVEKHWPGFCLLSQVIQEAIEIPELKVLDLGLGSEAYKAKFANESRDTLYVTLHSSLFSHLREVIRSRVAEILQSSPSLQKFAEALRKAWHSFRNRLSSEGVVRTFGWACKRVLSLVGSSDEVLFFEFTNSRTHANSHNAQLQTQVNVAQLHLLDLRRLADAAMEYEQDDDTLQYLLRAAQRLRKNEAQGYVLVNEKGTPVHFAWVSPFDGFYCSELDNTLQGPADAELVFDCWTPVAVRGHGYYKKTIELIADEIESKGRKLWIFSSERNSLFVKGLTEAGLELRYSLLRYRLLGWQTIKTHGRRSNVAPQAERLDSSPHKFFAERGQRHE